ncbi:hypothetical protein ACRAWD_12660 [Caulobacter segnis]
MNNAGGQGRPPRAARQRRRATDANIALGPWPRSPFVVLVFVVTLVRLGGNVAHPH